VSCGRDKTAKVWTQDGKPVLATEALGEIALRAVLAGNTVFVGDWNGTLKAYNVADGGKAFGDIFVTPTLVGQR
jgi:hypothetical protein